MCYVSIHHCIFNYSSSNYWKSFFCTSPPLPSPPLPSPPLPGAGPRGSDGQTLAGGWMIRLGTTSLSWTSKRLLQSICLFLHRYIRVLDTKVSSSTVVPPTSPLPSRLASFMGIGNSFDQYPRDWNLWFTSTEPENTPLPGLLEEVVLPAVCLIRSMIEQQCPYYSRNCTT